MLSSSNCLLREPRSHKEARSLCALMLRVTYALSSDQIGAVESVKAASDIVEYSHRII